MFDIIQGWLDLLTAGDYERVGGALGYGVAYGEPPALCIQRAVQHYRSPDYYPGVDTFVVTEWRTANGGNPAPKRHVTWYQPNSVGLAGAAEFDLPLNGMWSDLTASFVWFRGGPGGGCKLGLEEISSVEQLNREADIP